MRKRGLRKKAQFYIIAAMIIIAIVVGITTIRNYVEKRPPNTRVYDISKELNLESEKVINYGVYNQKDLPKLLENFSRDYSSYALMPNTEIYLIYGNTTTITVAGRIVGRTGEIFLNIGGGAPQTIPINGSQFFINFFTPTSGQREINVSVADTNYNFNLKEGENFFFIIQQEIQGEKYVAR